MNKKLIVLRGCPGSGKSTLAKEKYELAFLDYSHSDGARPYVVSADHYFIVNNVYCFDREELHNAHHACLWQAKKAMELNLLVIVDNTNTTWKEIQPYAELAKEHNYTVEVLEPDTTWKFDVEECSKKNTHSVPKESIQRMLNRWESTEFILEKLKTMRVLIKV